ncbi:MAG: hypothetical protein QNK89_03615 [Lacinutrix sp.]|uniref:hypothetical protein n=1 Tax=Lacinutrix sp. TaxID=1937692 RepID=UPI003095C949
MRITLLLLFITNICLAQIPAYYIGVDFNLTGDNLKFELESLITSTHTNLIPYTSSNLDTWDVLKQSDLNPNNASNVLLI